jgi:hypothetical protein
MRYGLTCGLALLFATSAVAQSKPGLELDIVYAKVGDKELRLDLARPAEGKESGREGLAC